MCFLIRYSLITDKQLLHAFRVLAFACWIQFKNHYVEENYPEFQVYGEKLNGMSDFYAIPNRHSWWTFNGGYFS